MEADQLLTTAEAAEFLNTPVPTMRWWRHQRTGPKAFRLGARKIMYKRSDLLAWLDKQYNSEQVTDPVTPTYDLRDDVAANLVEAVREPVVTDAPQETRRRRGRPRRAETLEPIDRVG